MKRGGRANGVVVAAGLVIATICWTTTGTAAAQHRFALEFFIGTAASFETPLKVEQGGHPDIDFSASYETKPFEQPVYWMFRADWSRGTARWELQLAHHKLYLENHPPDIQHFEVTHGYNLLTVNRAFVTTHMTWRVGAGVVIAHTESEIRGEREDNSDGGLFDQGYELAGPIALAGAGRSFDLTGRLLITPEIELTAAWARVSIAGGQADVPNVAFHVVVGLGVRI